MEQYPAKTALPETQVTLPHATPAWLSLIEVLHYATLILLLLWAFLFEHYRLAYEARVFLILDLRLDDIRHCCRILRDG